MKSTLFWTQPLRIAHEHDTLVFPDAGGHVRAEHFTLQMGICHCHWRQVTKVVGHVCSENEHATELLNKAVTASEFAERVPSPFHFVPVNIY